jgi:hypothetical protein
MGNRLEGRLAKLEQVGRDTDGRPGLAVMCSRDEYEAAREARQLPSRGLVTICPEA